MMGVVLCGLFALSWTEQRRGRALLEAISALVGFMIPSAIAYFREANDPATFWVAACAILLLFTAVRLVSIAVVRILFRKLILSTAPLCGLCGYNLSGNESGVCPECGTAVQEKAVSSQPSAVSKPASGRSTDVADPLSDKHAAE